MHSGTWNIFHRRGFLEYLARTKFWTYTGFALASTLTYHRRLSADTIHSLGCSAFRSPATAISLSGFFSVSCFTVYSHKHSKCFICMHQAKNDSESHGDFGKRLWPLLSITPWLFKKLNVRSVCVARGTPRWRGRWWQHLYHQHKAPVASGCRR